MTSRAHFALIMTTLTGCTQLLGALEEELEQEVIDRSRGAAGPGGVTGPTGPTGQPNPVCDDPGSGEEEPGDEFPAEINSIQPARGVTDGLEPVEIIGLGFTPGMRVFFGTFEAAPEFVNVESEFKINLLTPPAQPPGFYTVRLVAADANGQEFVAGLLENGFEYYDRVEILTVTPNTGPVAGGTQLEIAGGGFIAGTTVTFSSVGHTSAALAASVVDLNNLLVRTPEMPRGTYAVTVTNTNGVASLAAAFSAFEPVRADGVSPPAGPVGGGNSVTILGAGFVSGSQVFFDGQGVPGSGNTPENELDATVPPGVSEGPVTVRVANANGDWTLDNGYVYYVEGGAPRVLAVTPNTGLIDGGRDIHIVVSGYTDPDLHVFFDGVEIACNPPLGLHVITCTTPAGAVGPVRVRVDNATASESGELADGFSYVDVRLTVSLPTTGAIAGNTYVRLLGSGFATDARVYFDDRRAPSVTALNNTELVVRTPPRGSPGPVDVRVETQGVSVMADDMFTYFDPYSPTLDTSGGPINGSVNVTVTDGRGVRVEAAMVIIGPRADFSRPHLFGYTNARGQVTLSHPEIAGAQSVHAGKSGLGSFSWHGINSQNLTLSLANFPEPPPDPLPECPQGAGAPPPIVSGTVVRIKDEFNTGSDYVLVTTTYPEPYANLPDPGPGAHWPSDGEPEHDFAIVTRTGDLALHALAGQRLPDNTIDPHAIGFTPFLSIEASSGCACEADSDCPFDNEKCSDFGDGLFLCQRFYENNVITIDTPLNQPMRVNLDNPPLGIPTTTFSAAPVVTITDLWYDLGNMGVFSMNNYPLFPGLMGIPWPDPVVIQNAATMMFDMPRALHPDLSSATFNIYAQVYGEDPFFGDFSWSEQFVSGLSNTRVTQTLTPYLRVLQELQPAFLGTMSPDPGNFAVRQLPSTSTAPFATAHAHFYYQIIEQPVCLGPFGPVMQPMAWIYWQNVTPGTTNSWQIPRWPLSMSEANMPSTPLENPMLWQMISVYDPGASLNNASMDVLFRTTTTAGRISAFYVQ